MPGDVRSKLVGEFYLGAGRSNDFHRVKPKGIKNRLFGPYWYRADFEDAETTISSKILECHHQLTVNDYLASISIEHSGIVVYDAKVNRYDPTDHANRRFSMDEAWEEALREINSRYRQDS